MSKTNLVTSILASAIIGFSSGCISVPPRSLSMSSSELIEKDNHRKSRASVLEMPLEEKISRIEKDVNDSFVKIGDGFLSPIYSTTNGPGPLHLEHNAVLLSALSAKYAVTRDEKTKERADSIIKGIIEMDRLNGFDGYIPLMVDSLTRECTTQATHANAYDQLLFAYVHYTKNVSNNPDIQTHVSKIYERFVKDGFELRHSDGKLIREADLDRRFIEVNPSRALNRRVLDNVAFLLGDEETKKKARENKWHGVSVSPLRLDLGFLQIPTASSSWLDLLKLNILNECSLNYKKELVSLALDFSEMKNPFFQTLAYDLDNSIDISFVERRLMEYPYPINDTQIINSHRKDIEFRSKRYVKNKSKLETREALPLYELSCDWNLWKRNLFEADRQTPESGRQYFGVDLLQAYWFFEATKKKQSLILEFIKLTSKSERMLD